MDRSTVAFIAFAVLLALFKAWRAPKPRPSLVLGRELARARAAEARHAAQHGPAVRQLPEYDRWSGETDLLELKPAAADEEVRKLVHRWAEADDAARAEMQSRLTMDDFYTLITYSRRCTRCGHMTSHL